LGTAFALFSNFNYALTLAFGVGAAACKHFYNNSLFVIRKNQ